MIQKNAVVVNIGFSSSTNPIRKDEKKMWKKELWTQMGIVEGRHKMVVFSDLLENPMEMSPPTKKNGKDELCALSKIQKIEVEESTS